MSQSRLTKEKRLMRDISFKENHQWGFRSGTGDYRGSEFSEDAEIHGSPEITDCLIYGGNIFGTPTLRDSSLIGNPFISGKCGIIDSDVMGCSKITDLAVSVNSKHSGLSVLADKAIVFNSWLSGNCKVLESSVVNKCDISGNAVVCGNAVVMGCELDGYMFLDRGLWERPPLSFICSSGLVVNESVFGYVNVSCITNKIEKWLGGSGDRYGKLLGMSSFELEEVRYYVKLVRDKQCLENN